MDGHVERLSGIRQASLEMMMLTYSRPTSKVFHLLIVDHWGAQSACGIYRWHNKQAPTAQSRYCTELVEREWPGKPTSKHIKARPCKWCMQVLSQRIRYLELWNELLVPSLAQRIDDEPET